MIANAAWRVLLIGYLLYFVGCAVMLVRHDCEKGRRITVLRGLAIVLFSALWPVVVSVGLYVEHQVRHA
jgi:Na+/H+-translocating membrane pyrophosphatase